MPPICVDGLTPETMRLLELMPNLRQINLIDYRDLTDTYPHTELVATARELRFAEVEKNLRAELKTQYVVLSSDGWKDDSWNPITGVNATSNTGSSYLVDLIQSNGHKKEWGMIDKAESTYGCIIVLFCCDNDGGSQRGRKDLALKRPWLLVAPCCVHQSELMLGDYLAVHELAADIAAEATELIHWIIGHDRVCKIFDHTQFEKNFKVLLTEPALIKYFSHFPPLYCPSEPCGREGNDGAYREALGGARPVACLVLNPYESLERFGDKAGINVFVLNTEWIAEFISSPHSDEVLFRRVRSRPRNRPRRPAEDAAREKAVSAAFMNYLQGTGDFAPWRANKEEFQRQHPDDPQLVWQELQTCEGVADLARFAILLLGLVVNQVPNERSFSDLKIRKTRLRNRLRTKKLEKMSKVVIFPSNSSRAYALRHVGASICAENLAAGLINKRAARQVHDPTKVSGLLSVPRYADILEISDNESGTSQPSKLVKSGAAWRASVREWVNAAQEDEELGNAAEQPAPQAGRSRTASFFPRSLALLFGGNVKSLVGKPCATQFTEEVLMMELLATEESDEELDDGALSGSGDDFEM
ncbi:hypothetical protein DFH09DRAFT_1072310 [Mycena vulgaris]|nr:hypothetical protein DFH09DRAFT_1072310 [Mycena vulgaris]